MVGSSHKARTPAVETTATGTKLPLVNLPAFAAPEMDVPARVAVAAAAAECGPRGHAADQHDRLAALGEKRRERARRRERRELSRLRRAHAADLRRLGRASPRRGRAKARGVGRLRVRRDERDGEQRAAHFHARGRV